MFSNNDGLGLDIQVPYYAIKLTPEQAEAVQFTKLNFFASNGKTMFAVKDKDGKETGEQMIFVTFEK